MTEFAKALEAALAGGPQRHHEKTAEQGKLPVRERVERLVDPGSFAEEGAAGQLGQEGLGADGVVTGLATIDGRRVALMANDPTVKAGSWGPKTVEKILRIQERALKLQMPMVYLVDSAGARITDQVQMFPGRRGAGRIFHNEVRLSGQVPQVCLLFGPSAAGGAYIPAFCDVVIMREGNASMYLGSPRMAEMVIGEKVTLEEMGGAKMHTGVSGCGHFLVKSDEEAIDLAKRYLSFMPGNWREEPPGGRAGAPASEAAIAEIVPADENQPFDMREVLDVAARRRLLPRGPQALGERADRRLRAARRPRRRHRRQPAAAEGRRALRRLGRQGGALHPDLQRLQRAAALPRRRARLHDRHRGRAPGDHPPRGEDDQRRLRGDGAEDLGDRPQGLRRRPLRDGRPGLRARLLHRPAERLDRRDGPAGGGQRRLLQPDPGDRGRGRARALRRREARGVRRGHRHPPPRLRAGRRRGGPARGPARRADPALRLSPPARTAPSPSAATRSRPPERFL